MLRDSELLEKDGRRAEPDYLLKNSAMPSNRSAVGFRSSGRIVDHQDITLASGVPVAVGTFITDRLRADPYIRVCAYGSYEG
jgi:hypothetical protein